MRPPFFFERKRRDLNNELEKKVETEKNSLVHLSFEIFPIAGGVNGDAGEGWDDRILVEAVLPLLRGLAERASAAATGQARPASPPLEQGEKPSSSADSPFDVRAHLSKRFGLRGWFRSQGVVVGEEAMIQMEEEEGKAAAPPVAAAPRGRQRRSSPSSTSSASSSSVRLPAVAEEEVEDEEEESASSLAPALPPLAVFDFDHTLVCDFDSAEDVVSQLAPELVPMLTSIAMPANFVPLTNAVAAEAARRGVGERHWLAALADAGRRGLLGKGNAGGGAGVLRAAAAGGAEVRILSDANDLFISAMLVAAGLGPEAGVVSGVITNRAKFVPISPAATTATAGSTAAAAPSASSSPPSSRLVVEPRHDAAKVGPHGCALCPSNLCKGLELRKLVGGEVGRSGSVSAAARRRVASSSRRRRTVVYAGDGENDLCPALALEVGDSLLVRRSRGLERLLRERAAAETETCRRSASFLRQHPTLSRAFDASLSSALAEGAHAFLWDSAEELRELVEVLLLCEERAAEVLLSDL